MTYVTVANNMRLRTSMQGIVVLKARGSRTHITLNNVLIVRNLCFNLLLAEQLMDCGVDLSTEPETRDILLHYTIPNKTRKQIGRAHSENGVYILDLSIPDCSGDSQELIDFVPLRFEHIHHRNWIHPDRRPWVPHHAHLHKVVLHDPDPNAICRDCHTPTASTRAIVGRGLAAIAEAEWEAPPEETATRVIFDAEENPHPIPASQHLRGMLRGTDVGTFDAHKVPLLWHKRRIWRIAKQKSFASGVLRSRVAHSPGADGEKRRAPPMKGGGEAPADGARATLVGGEQQLAARQADGALSAKAGGLLARTKGGKKRKSRRNLHDPWDTIDWGNEPSTLRRTVYGPAHEPREPTFFPGTIPGTNIPLSNILDRGFLSLMLTTASGDDEAEETAAEPAQAPDEDPAEAHVHYMRTSGFRADDTIWHQRLGHPSRVTLKNCIEAGLFVPGALLRPDGTEVRDATHPRNYTVCPEATLSHQSFPLLEPGTNRYAKLEKVYSDFLNVGHCGINNELYTLTFVDARMRYVWVVNVEARSRAYEVFRLWLAHAQRQSGEKLKIWKSDGATEFRSKEMQDYLAKKGIEHHVSLPYAHQQQGVAERTNRMLMTKVQALMKQPKLPPTYWTYAMHHAVRVHNLLSTTAITSNSSPHVKWTGTKGNASMLHVTVSRLQLLGLHTATSTAPRVIEPKNPRQALTGPYSKEWREAMDAEIKALESRDTWVLIDRAAIKGRRVLSGIWVFRVKTAADGTIERFKARWVVRGYDQKYGIDLDQTFEPVSRHTSVRILLTITTARHLPLRQIDVKNAFLYALVDSVIHVEQPHTYGEGDSRVCQLQKSLYGIKQAPRLWQQNLRNILLEIGFKQLPHDYGMYRRDFRGEYILLTVYVDDLLYTGSSNKLLEQFVKSLAGRVDITCNYDVKQFLGLNISYSPEAIHLSAAKYAEELGKRFNIAPAPLSTPYRTPGPNHKPDNKALSPAGLHTYQQQLGCLLFTSITCRTDLSYIAS
ncbi:unnamed protein product [Closterium sp. NIES-54]